VLVHVIAHIGKEANQLDQRESGELTGDTASDTLLNYDDPSIDTWRTEDLPRLRQIPLAQAAAATGLSERRLRDIYAGRATPHKSTKDRLLARHQTPCGQRDPTKLRSDPLSN
jgi:hypothetical protein